MKRTLFCMPFLLVLAGCANPYAKFYTDFTGGRDILEDPYFVISEDEPQLVRGTDGEKDIERMLENGYLCLGVSSFNSEGVDENKALEHAKKIHAEKVIVYSRYSHTISGVRPLTLPDTQTSTAYHSGNIYGYGGSAHYSGTSYSTTHGTKTTYIPYSKRRYDYHASFWGKWKPRLGVHFDDLTDELRKELGTNKGIYVRVVAKNSPAYNNDLLKGDVIRRVNAVSVIDKAHFAHLLEENTGQKIELEIYRDGQTTVKQIQLN